MTIQKSQSQNKNEMFTVNNECHTILWKAGLKAAPDKTFFLKKVKFLGHVISPDGIQPIAKLVKNSTPIVEEYVSMDRRPDNFNERFMDQRIQKINNAGKSGMEDYLISY